MKTHIRKLPALYSRAYFSPDTVNEENRTVDVIWSTGVRVRRTQLFDEDFLEELSLAQGAVKLERLNQGAPLLNSHQKYSVSDVIGVVEKAWLDNNVGYARVRFSSRDEVMPIFRDVKEGILRNISVGYRVHRYQNISNANDTMRVLRAIDWEPFELSLVPIGADAHAVVRGEHALTFDCDIIHSPSHLTSTRGNQPVIETTETAVTEQPVTPSPLVATTPTPATDETRTLNAHAAQQERQRVTDILHAVRTAKLGDTFAEQLITDGTDIHAARARILDAWASEQASVQPRNQVRMQAGQLDETETRRSAVMNALLHRYDSKLYALNDAGKQYRGYSLLELAREFIERNGASTRGLTKLDIAQRALHTTSDFPFILANVANKTLRDAYDTAPQTFRPFVRETQAVDFKLITRVQLGDAPRLEKVNEHGEFTYGSISEAQEQYKVATYGKIVSLSRQTIINDDLDAFTRIPQLFGRAAANLESDLVYLVLNQNPKMGDGKPIFHALHNNLASSGDAINIDSVSDARTALRLQTGLDDDANINLQPRYLLVPAALETIADQFVSTNFQPANQQTINPFAGRLQVISEPRLDSASTIAWYLLADPAQIDMIEIAYLEGQRGVALETRSGFEIDGIEIKARLDVGVKAIDWRGFYKNPGKSS